MLVVCFKQRKYFVFKKILYAFFYKIIFFICIILGLFFVYGKFFNSKSNKKYGKVIILNGPSATGKTSLQKEFQELMRIEKDELWIKIGIDNSFDNVLPPITLDNLDFYRTKNNIRWVENTVDQNNNPVVTLYIGSQGKKVIDGMHDAIVAYAKSGNNVIVDYIMYDPLWYSELEKKLEGVPHYWIKLDIDLKTLEEREKSRNTSPVGHARSHYFSVHKNIKYDYVINCNTKTAKELALELKNKIIL